MSPLLGVEVEQYTGNMKWLGLKNHSFELCKL